MVIVDGRRYRVCCGGLVDAAFACEVLGKAQSGICVELDVVCAAAVALVGKAEYRFFFGEPIYRYL